MLTQNGDSAGPDGIACRLVVARIDASDRAALHADRELAVEAIGRDSTAFLGARLVELQDGTWMDLMWWTTLPHAEEAIARFSALPEAMRMRRYVNSVVLYSVGVVRAPSPGSLAGSSE